MLEIKNRNDLKVAYGYIRLCEEFKKEHKERAAVVDKYIKNVKKDIRSYVSKNRNIQSVGNSFIEQRIVKDYGLDGFIELVGFPIICLDYESAEEFFKEWLYIEPYRSAYDCTGKPFTSWYKIFERNGQFYAYHSVSFDV